MQKHIIEIMKLKFLIPLCVFILSFSQAQAWGTIGHRVIAEIAERNLTKKAKRNIYKVTENQKLAYFANWPDFVKSDSRFKDNDSWHYINLEANLSEEECREALENSSEKNLYKRVLILIDELEKDNLSDEKEREYLYYLIHMIGDAHQPMHMGRPQDLGGNKISVKWFGQPTNIHAVWDSKLVDFEKYSYTEYAEVLNVSSKHFKKNIQKGDFADWCYDTHVLCNEIYDNIVVDQNLRYEYHYKYKQVVEDQMMKAGLRLAKILNTIYR